MKEMAWSRLEKARHAIVTAVSVLVSAVNVLRLIEKDEARDKEIEPAIIIIVKPHGVGGPARSGDPRLVSHVGERSVAIVVVKNVASVPGHVQIDPAIAVIISGGYTHSKCAAGYASLVRDVGESAIMIIVVQSILQRRGGSVEIRGSAVYQVNVH